MCYKSIKTITVKEESCLIVLHCYTEFRIKASYHKSRRSLMVSMLLSENPHLSSHCWVRVIPKLVLSQQMWNFEDRLQLLSIENINFTFFTTVQFLLRNISIELYLLNINHCTLILSVIKIYCFLSFLGILEPFFTLIFITFSGILKKRFIYISLNFIKYFVN